MIILRADNRALIVNAKFSYLAENYNSGVSTIQVTNATDGFEADAFVLLGNIGSENAEILKISSVTAATGTVVFTTSTIFAHSESTRATIIPYDKVRFFHTTTTTYSDTDPLTGYLDLQPSDWYSIYEDNSYSSGYGWFIFYNSATSTASQPSNPLPYAGFDSNTIETILNDFFSLLNNKELKLVSRQDALSWLNEGYSIVRNKLNLTNVEYNASTSQSLSVVSGTSEYALEDDFSHMLTVTTTTTGNARNIGWISLKDAPTYQGSEVKYYIRGSYIGFVPAPTSNATYSYTYNKKTSRLSSNDDLIDLPDNGFFVIKDFMMYRAYLKFTNPNYKVYYDSFTNGLNQMIISSIQRDANLDTWSIENSANV